jgi:hypothetical protein
MPTENEGDRFAEMQKVIELYVQNINPTKIANSVGIRRVDVLSHIEAWRATAVGSDIMKERVEELIASMDQHYSLLIQKAYEIIDEVDDEAALEGTGRKSTMTRAQMLSQKLGALKAIADFESKRIDVLQKSGLLEAADLGDELAAIEEKMEKVFDILDEFLCGNCRPVILGRLKPLISGEPAENVVVVVSG